MRKITTREIHSPSERLEVFLFNVGQGDHVMLKFPNTEYGIIDFHYDAVTDAAEPPALSYFKELKRELSESEFKKITISFFCISHTDKDHVKGIAETIKWFHDNGIFIRDFWLGAARDKLQLRLFLKEKVNSLIDTFRLDELNKYSEKIDRFKQGIEDFFEYFEKWKRGEFQSERYQTESVGNGEYLVDIKLLPRPCSLKKAQAVNMGPLGRHLDDYINRLSLDAIKELLGIRDKKDIIDKNRISHILKLRFGDINLLFGGDTDRIIWEECLRTYENPNNSHADVYGNFDAHFIKVSHHGSSKSSSPEIWSKIIPSSGKAYLGISAGRNLHYKHPNSDTLREIRNCGKGSDILSTNICEGCLEKSTFESEYHQWYDDFIARNLKYGKEEPNNVDEEINEVFRQTTCSERPEGSSLDSSGLFAYIVEVPDNIKEEIKIRVALSKTNKSNSCFFKDHKEKLFMCCG